MVKRHSYVPGEPINPCEPNHEWNAVHLPGSGWHLIDLTWAAGHLDPESNNFHHHLQEHYLLAHPRDFARDHFPCLPKWQLLKQPLTLSEFQDEMYLKPGFFQLNILQCNLTSGILHCSNERALISFHLSQLLCFTYNLVHKSSGLNLDQCVTLEWTKSDCHFHLFFPKPGSYIFRAYARTGSGPMEAVLVQRIESHWIGVPKCPETRLALLLEPVLWGFTQHAEDLPLKIPTNFSTKLSVCSKTSSITTPPLLVTKELHVFVVVYLHARKRADFSSGRILRTCIIKPHNRTKMFSLKLQIQERNQLWRLAIFAQKSISDKPKCFCNFLLETWESDISCSSQAHQWQLQDDSACLAVMMSRSIYNSTWL